VSRRSGTPLALVALAVTLLLTACGGPRWHDVNVSGGLPPLAFTLTRASDAKPVTATDYHGKTTLLYFGYTFCPDVCPTTLAALDKVMDQLGPRAANVRVLFVTVDPNRDTLAVLKTYAASFGPNVVGLRGSPDQLAALARRYRIAYSVHPGDASHPYSVTHGSAVYVFDRDGRARLIIPSLATSSPDLAGVAADLRRLTAPA
jgi:protein SCO1/2